MKRHSHRDAYTQISNSIYDKIFRSVHDNVLNTTQWRIHMYANNAIWISMGRHIMREIDKTQPIRNVFVQGRK